MARRIDAKTREVFEHTAQHLKHGRFGNSEAAKLLGVSVQMFVQLACNAERRHPKLCKGSCFFAGTTMNVDTRAMPRCPYCAHVAALHRRVLT